MPDLTGHFEPKRPFTVITAPSFFLFSASNETLTGSATHSLKRFRFLVNNQCEADVDVLDHWLLGTLGSQRRDGEMHSS